MDKEIFNTAFSRAVTLMNDKRFNAIVESKSRNSKKGNGGNSDLSHLEAQAFGYTQTPSVIEEQYTQQQVIPNGKSAASVLPQAIRESFNNLPPQQINTPISPLDNVQAIKETQLKRQIITMGANGFLIIRRAYMRIGF